jgi:ABC-type amino acid transport system permease subunit
MSDRTRFDLSAIPVSNWVHGVVLTLVGSLAGLVLALGVGVALGLAEPPWWGGKALLPLLVGGITLIVGSIPFYAVLHLILRWTAGVEREHRVTCVLFGALVGGALLPMFLLLGFLGQHGVVLGPAFEQLGLHPLLAALIIVGAASAAAAATIVSVAVRFQKLRGSKGGA